MKRRNVLTDIGALTALLFGANKAKGHAPGKARGATRTGTFLAEKPGIMQDLAVVKDQVYALTRDSTSGRFTVNCSSLRTGLLWRQELKDEFPLAMGVDPNGAISLHTLGYLKTHSQHIVRFNPSTGKTAIIREVPDGGRLFHLTSGDFVRAASVGLQSLKTVGPDINVKTLTAIDPSIKSIAVEPVSSTEGCVIDVDTCRVISLNVSGEAKELPVVASELNESREFNKKIRDLGSGNKNAATPQVVTATGCDGNFLYMMLSPYTRDWQANVLLLELASGNTTSISLTLPKVSMVGGPMKIARVEEELYVLFSTGSFAVYSEISRR